MRFQCVLNILFNLHMYNFIFCIQYRHIVTIYTALIQLVIIY